MLEQLRAWLNSKKDYTTGVMLYCKYGDNALLKKLLLKEKTEYNIRRLQEEIKELITVAKQTTSSKTDNSPKASVDAPQTEISTKIDQPKENHALHQACISEANKVYKDAMNNRAILFKMVPGEMYQDPNGPNEKLFRSDLAIKVVKLYKEASELYDRADYVKKHGELPPNEATERTFDINAIPDVMVYQELDLRRKSLNKNKKKEQSAARVIVIQNLEDEIKQLEQKWQSLKQAR